MFIVTINTRGGESEAVGEFEMTTDGIFAAAKAATIAKIKTSTDVTKFVSVSVNGNKADLSDLTICETYGDDEDAESFAKKYF